MYSFHNILVFIVQSRTLTGVGKHIKYKIQKPKQTKQKKNHPPLINRFSYCVFYVSVKTTENLITSLHSFVCLECHLLFSVMRFAKIALFPCQHLLSAGLYCLSLKATSLAPFFFFPFYSFFLLFLASPPSPPV